MFIKSVHFKPNNHKLNNNIKYSRNNTKEFCVKRTNDYLVVFFHESNVSYKLENICPRHPKFLHYVELRIQSRFSAFTGVNKRSVARLLIHFFTKASLNMTIPLIKSWIDECRSYNDILSFMPIRCCLYVSSAL